MRKRFWVWADKAALQRRLWFGEKSEIISCKNKKKKQKEEEVMVTKQSEGRRNRGICEMRGERRKV